MVIRRFLTVALSGMAVFLGSCVTNSASIYIVGALAPDTSTCTVDVSASALVETSVDTALPGGVNVAFLVNNLIQKRNFNVAVDVSTVIVTQAEISITDASGASLAGGAFLVDTAGGVVEGSLDGISPGQGVVTVQVLPPAALAQIAALAASNAVTVTANITLRGRTVGHVAVEGGPFPWAITLLPPKTLEDPACVQADARTCCNGGRSGEVYCSNLPGLCAPIN